MGAGAAPASGQSHPHGCVTVANRGLPQVANRGNISCVSSKKPSSPSSEESPLSKTKANVVEIKTKTKCANGHPRAEYWTETAKGRQYCRKCAVEASQRSRAKSLARQKLSPEALDAIRKVATFKNTKAETSEELLAFVERMLG